MKTLVLTILIAANWLDVTTNLEEAQRRTAQIKSANCK